MVQACVHAYQSCLEVFTKESDTFICDCVIAEIQMSHERVSRQCLDQYLNILHWWMAKHQWYSASLIPRPRPAFSHLQNHCKWWKVGRGCPYLRADCSLSTHQLIYPWMDEWMGWWNLLVWQGYDLLYPWGGSCSEQAGFPSGIAPEQDCSAEDQTTIHIQAIYL